MGRSHPVGEATTATAIGAGCRAKAGERYTLAAILMHWVMAVLLIGQLAMGFYMVDLPKRTPEVAYYYNLHKSFGLLGLVLIVIRLTWRWHHLPPASPGLHRSALQARLAQLSHRLLYACMLLIPVLGFAGSSFGKYPVKFFGHALPRLGWESPLIQGLFREAHAALAWLLTVLIVLHLVAVVYHITTSGTAVLRRMVPSVWQR